MYSLCIDSEMLIRASAHAIRQAAYKGAILAAPLEPIDTENQENIENEADIWITPMQKARDVPQCKARKPRQAPYKKK